MPLQKGDGLYGSENYRRCSFNFSCKPSSIFRMSGSCSIHLLLVWLKYESCLLIGMGDQNEDRPRFLQDTNAAQSSSVGKRIDEMQSVHVLEVINIPRHERDVALQRRGRKN